jgi:predicted molibdopterin-dependent oxidoreductase YjgC
MVVAGPDFINIAEYAALPIYHRPHTETALINGFMHIILEKGWEDQNSIKEHRKGFDDFKTIIDRYTPQVVSGITGLSVDSLYKAAEILAANRPTAVIWSVGLADPIVARSAVCSLVNLQLLLGNLDSPGGGLTPLRVYSNSQGACDLGVHPAMLPGYQPVGDEPNRNKFEQAWGISIPSYTGLAAPEILDAVRQGHLKALYILGEDIINTSLNAAKVRQGLESCDFIVLQEILPSETTRYADVLLPGVSFAEKTGTFTSAERRIQLVQKAIKPLGEALPDWQIIAALARQILSNNGRTVSPATFSDWEYSNTEQIMAEIAALTPIYAGVSHTRLSAGAQLHWPIPSPDHPGTLQMPTTNLHWSLIEQIPLKPEEDQRLVLA